MGSRVRVPYAPPTFGTLTEWLGSGLQNRVQQFESAGYLTQASSFQLLAFLFSTIQLTDVDSAKAMLLIGRY